MRVLVAHICAGTSNLAATNVAATSRASRGAIGVTATHVFSYDKMPGSYGIGIYSTGAHPPATL